MLDILISSDPPMFIKRPISVAGDKDERVTLHCLVDANPAPTYSWFKTSGSSQKTRLVGNAANLSLIVSKDTVGEYICQATTVVPGFTRNAERQKAVLEGIDRPVAEEHANNVISAVAKVMMKDKPKIYTDRRVQFANLNTIGRLVCEAVSVPTVETVEWFYSGGLPVLTGSGGKFSVLENRSNDGVRSTLVIAGVNEDDIGEYRCRVTNSLGTDSISLSLQLQGKRISLTISVYKYFCW